MKELTLILDDDLNDEFEDYANDTGFTFEESIVRALYYWFHDIIPDADELDDLGMTESEWYERWGMNDNEVVDSLRRDPLGMDAAQATAPSHRPRLQPV